MEKKSFNEKVADGTYVINSEYYNLFGDIKWFISETNTPVSVSDYNCLSDSQKRKCRPVYK